MDTKIKVMIVDDHEVVREGLLMFLEDATDDIEVVGQAASGAEAVDLAGRLRPDVILMDLLMPKMDGIEATRRIRESGLTSRILILTSFAEDGQVRDAIDAGATGYLLKDVLREDLVNAIHASARGKAWLHPEAQQSLMRQLVKPAEPSPFDPLTERETDVLRLIARGKSNKEIAADLFLTVGTVKGYVSAVLSKLGLADRTQAALFAARHGLLSD